MDTSNPFGRHLEPTAFAAKRAQEYLSFDEIVVGVTRPVPLSALASSRADHRRREVLAAEGRDRDLQFELEARIDQLNSSRWPYSLELQLPAGLIQQIRVLSKSLWPTRAAREAFVPDDAFCDYTDEFRRHIYMLSRLCEHHLVTPTGWFLHRSILLSLEFFDDQIFVDHGLSPSKVSLFRVHGDLAEDLLDAADLSDDEFFEPLDGAADCAGAQCLEAACDLRFLTADQFERALQWNEPLLSSDTLDD